MFGEGKTVASMLCKGTGDFYTEVGYYVLEDKTLPGDTTCTIGGSCKRGYETVLR